MKKLSINYNYVVTFEFSNMEESEKKRFFEEKDKALNEVFQEYKPLVAFEKHKDECDFVIKGSSENLSNEIAIFLSAYFKGLKVFVLNLCGNFPFNIRGKKDYDSITQRLGKQVEHFSDLAEIFTNTASVYPIE